MAKQKQRLARIGGQRCHVVLRAARQGAVGLTQGRAGAGPDKMEGAEKCDLRALGAAAISLGIFQMRASSVATAYRSPVS
jgi:hypothetical protein